MSTKSFADLRNHRYQDCTFVVIGFIRPAKTEHKHDPKDLHCSVKRSLIISSCSHLLSDLFEMTETDAFLFWSPDWDFLKYSMLVFVFAHFFETDHVRASTRMLRPDSDILDLCVPVLVDIIWLKCHRFMRAHKFVWEPCWDKKVSKSQRIVSHHKHFRWHLNFGRSFSSEISMKKNLRSRRYFRCEPFANDRMRTQTGQKMPACAVLFVCTHKNTTSTNRKSSSRVYLP